MRSLPWEEHPLSLVFGNDEPLPAIPSVDRVGPRVDHAASVVTGECNLDVSPDDPAWSNGFLDIVSLSHKTRAMSAALGLQLNLVAPSRGVSKVCWLKGFVSACEQALRPLTTIFEVVRSSRNLQDSNSEERAWYEQIQQGSDFASAVPPPKCEKGLP